MWRELVGDVYKITDESKAALLYFDHKEFYLVTSR